MADSSLPNLTEDTNPAGDSLLYTVDDPAGTPVDRKVTVTNLSKNVTPEGTNILSTGEVGGSKFLREDGDGTSSWQAIPGGGDMLASTYDPGTVSEQLVGLTATQTLTNKTLTNPTIDENILLDTSPATPSTAEGALYYDSTNKALAVKNDEADVTLQVGQESWVRVYNDSGATIFNGEVVYASGKEDVEDRLTIAKAQADADTTSKVIGFATHDIENATFGWVTQFGYIGDVNTSSFADGASIWLSATTAGAITDTQPESPDNAVFLGYVVDSAISGNLFITTLGNTSGSGVTISDATQIIQNARKGSAGTINKGQPVYISGYNTGQGVIEIELADSDNASAMPAVGIANDSITNATTGQVVLSGRVANIDTSTYSLGDALYVDTTAGALTATRPTGATTAVQKVANVARVNASTGVIIVVGAGRTNDQPNYHTDDIFRIADNADTTKLINFQASGITTGTTRTITMPDADIDLANVPSSAEKTVLGNTSGTNTGDQTSVTGTSGNTDALNSATTVVDVSAATAPSTGQILTATSSTTATWQTPAGGGGGNPYGADRVVAASGGDHTTLGAALTAASAGDVIYIENGTYSESTISNTTADITIIGQSREGVILSFGANNCTLNAANRHIKNVTFTLSTGYLQDLGQDSHMTDVDISITGNPASGFGSWYARGTDARYTRVKFTTSDTTSMSGKYSARVRANNAVFRDCYFGLNINGTGTGSGGIALLSGNTTQFSGCTIQVLNAGTNSTCVYLGDTAASFVDCKFLGSGGSDYGIYAVSGPRTLISGCYFSSWSRHITLALSSNVGGLVTGNLLYVDAGDTGIYISGDNYAVTGNFLYGSNSTDTGITAISGGDNNLVHGNFVRNFATATNDSGTGNTFSDNKTT